MRRPRKQARMAQTVSELSDQAQQAADQTANPLPAVVAAIKTAMQSGTDPYLLVGVLLEGIVQTLTSAIPPERRPATELATLTMLQQRLSHPSVVCGGTVDPCNPTPDIT